MEVLLHCQLCIYILCYICIIHSHPYASFGSIQAIYLRCCSPHIVYVKSHITAHCGVNMQRCLLQHFGYRRARKRSWKQKKKGPLAKQQRAIIISHRQQHAAPRSTVLRELPSESPGPRVSAGKRLFRRFVQCNGKSPQLEWITAVSDSAVAVYMTYAWTGIQGGIDIQRILITLRLCLQYRGWQTRNFKKKHGTKPCTFCMKCILFYLLFYLHIASFFIFHNCIVNVHKKAENHSAPWRRIWALIFSDLNSPWDERPFINMIVKV